VGLNGAAAHLVSVGHLLILASYGLLDEAEMANHQPRAVFVDAQNRITEIRRQERNPPQKLPRSA